MHMVIFVIFLWLRSSSFVAAKTLFFLWAKGAWIWLLLSWKRGVKKSVLEY